MSTLSDIFRAWSADVQTPPPPSLSDATDILQTFAPTVSDTDGDAWWEAVGAEWGRLGLVTPSTYVGLRNFTNGNEAGANELFDALISAMNNLPESAVVLAGLNAQNDADQLAAIPGNITTIEGFKTGGTSVADVQLDTALDEAIASLRALEAQLTT